MKNSFIKTIMVLATLICGSNVINAADNAFTNQAPELEMQMPDLTTVQIALSTSTLLME